MTKGLLAGIAVAAVAAAAPAVGSAAGFSGVVVARQHANVLVASPSGVVRSLHARARVGARIALRGRTAVVVGSASHARIRGIVVRRVGTTLILSSNRHLIAIPNRLARRLAADAPPATTAAPGAVVSTDVSIRNGELEEENEDEVGEVAADSIAVQATITAVASGSVTLDVQGHAVTVPLPAGLTLPASLVGQTVTLSLSLGRHDDEEGDDGGDDDHGGHGGGDD